MKIIYEVLVIVLIATFMAVAYNFVNPNKIDFIKSEKEVTEVSDDELFGNSQEEDKVTENNTESQNSQESETPKDIKPEEQKQKTIDNDETERAINDAVNATLEQKNNKEEKATPKKITPNEENKDLSVNDIGAHSDGDFKVVNYNQMLKLKDMNDFILVDARHPEQFDKSKIGDAVNIYPYVENEEQIFDKIFQLPYDKNIVVYCDGGNCDSSHKLAEYMINLGYEKVYIYIGGWEEWVKKQGL